MAITVMGVERLRQAILAAGVAVESVNSAGVVAPSSLQASAQSTIDAFDSSPAADAAFQQQQDAKAVNRAFGLRKSADDSTSSASFADVPGLSFTLAPNSSYKFRFAGGYTTALAATGVQLSVNGPASPTFLAFSGLIAETATTIRAGVGGAYDAAIAALASAGATAMPFWIDGSITTGAAGGAFVLRYRTETAASAVTIKRGSIGELMVVS